MGAIDGASLVPGEQMAQSFRTSEAAIMAARDPEVFQLLEMAAKERDRCFLMPDTDWDEYDKTAVNRARDLGFVKVHLHGSGWGNLTGWKLTKRGEVAVGLPVRTGLISRLLAFITA
jgi:hypothetical protein